MSRQANPIYLSIASVLRDELGNYQPGELLPGELPLAKRFEVNRHTIRRALDVLAQEGYVLRIQGRGTEVLEAPLRYPVMGKSAYSDWFNATGHEAEARLLGSVQRSAEALEIEQLGLSPQEEVVEYRTLRLIDDSPISLIRHCFAARHAEVLKEYKKGSMRRYLKQQGHELTRVSSLIGARLPSTQEATRLMMPVQRPVLTVQTVSKNQYEQAFELALSVSRADRFQYQVLI